MIEKRKEMIKNKIRIREIHIKYENEEEGYGVYRVTIDNKKCYAKVTIKDKYLVGSSNVPEYLWPAISSILNEMLKRELAEIGVVNENYYIIRYPTGEVQEATFDRKGRLSFSEIKIPQ